MRKLSIHLVSVLSLLFLFFLMGGCMSAPQSTPTPVPIVDPTPEITSDTPPTQTATETETAATAETSENDAITNVEWTWMGCENDEITLPSDAFSPMLVEPDGTKEALIVCSFQVTETVKFKDVYLNFQYFDYSLDLHRAGGMWVLLNGVKTTQYPGMMLEPGKYEVKIFLWTQVNVSDNPVSVEDGKLLASLGFVDYDNKEIQVNRLFEK